MGETESAPDRASAQGGPEPDPTGATCRVCSAPGGEGPYCTSCGAHLPSGKKCLPVRALIGAAVWALATAAVLAVFATTTPARSAPAAAADLPTALPATGPSPEAPVAAGGGGTATGEARPAVGAGGPAPSGPALPADPASPSGSAPSRDTGPVPPHGAASPQCERAATVALEGAALRAVVAAARRGTIPGATASELLSSCEQTPDQLADALNRGGLQAHRRRDYVRSSRLWELALRVDPSKTAARYNLACAYALLGRPEDAMVQLRELHRAGVAASRWMARAQEDSDLDTLRSRPEFEAMVGRPVAPAEPEDESPEPSVDSPFE